MRLWAIPQQQLRQALWHNHLQLTIERILPHHWRKITQIHTPCNMDYIMPWMLPASPQHLLPLIYLLAVCLSDSAWLHVRPSVHFFLCVRLYHASHLVVTWTCCWHTTHTVHALFRQFMLFSYFRWWWAGCTYRTCEYGRAALCM